MDSIRGTVVESAKSVWSFLNGDGLIPQLLLTILIILVFHTIILSIETVVDAFKQYDRLQVPIFEDTHTSTTTYDQDADTDNKLIYPSSNELNGMEFSYSFHMFIERQTFDRTVSTCTTSGESNAQELRHIFHKGGELCWPLLAPGVFVHGDKNTLRVYMNATDEWNQFVDIPNIPVGKWVHCVILMKGKFMDVYINGNVTIRHEFATVPRLNYGPVTIFAQKGLVRDDFNCTGAASGMISRLTYYAYALSYSQIDTLYRQGPSKVITTPERSDKPPYLHDSWWVTKY